MVTSTDIVILALGGIIAFVYLFKDKLIGKQQSVLLTNTANGDAALGADGNDFVAKLENQKKRIAIFYGSQTGTAEEYATKIAKEAKARFGTSSLVCDPEEYEFEKLDQVPENCVIIFVMATYGEGEPTDNSVTLMEFLNEETPSFSNGDRLENLNYVVFGLGNRTYEHFNEIGRKLDKRLEDLGAKRIGAYGEGDDDKSMEEDYLAWKDGMFEALSKDLGFEEGGGAEVADFKVQEIEPTDPNRVYHGELSARALLGTKGIHDAKNPYAARITETRELFTEGVADRSCVHMEFDIEGSGISYQHGDHLAVWANNPEKEADRMLSVLGLLKKRDQVIDVESLDPTLAKVPFPVPTTYGSVFRHYLDICAHASRQTISNLAKYAPSDKARAEAEKIGSDKEYYHKIVGERCLKIAEVLQYCAGDDLQGDVTQSTPWNIPFDRVISDIPRVGPRFYSISSSPKLHPKSIHITAVILRYKPQGGDWHVHGLATNYISSIKQKIQNQTVSDPKHPLYNTPLYDLQGPRGAYFRDDQFRVPIHIRRSNFRLPTSPKIPVIMVGPGTGVAPFRSFVQERVASADKAREKAGPDASSDPLADWGNIWLFYGCRKRGEDFLYADEWPQYESKLGGKLRMEVSLSREKFKPDGGKLYVQDLIYERRKELAADILEKKAYIFICGEAKGMAQEVEAMFVKILAEAKGSEQAGKQEVKMLKERSRLLLDVWS